MGNSIEVSQKIENGATILLSNSTHKYLPKENKWMYVLLYSLWSYLQQLSYGNRLSAWGQRSDQRNAMDIHTQNGITTQL